MKMAVLAACLWSLQSLSAIATDYPDAAYRFEVRSSLEKLNLLEKLSTWGVPCSFVRTEPDGSVTRVIVCSDSLAKYLSTLQMPSVTLTFKAPEGETERNRLATIHGVPLESFADRYPSGYFYIIRNEDPHGKVVGYH